MAFSQNTTIDKSKLIIGNCKIETAASAAGSYVNLGNGKVTSFIHNITKYDVQGQNGPDPIEGIADETGVITAELIEYDGSVLSAIMCGAISESNTTTLSTINAGGNIELTPRAFRITNTWMYSSTTVETILTLYHGTIDNGIEIQLVGDQESDPIGKLPISITGKNDVSRTTGNQLYSLTRTIVE